MQRLLHKRYHCKGHKQWCIDAKTIADASADQAFEGKHYFRSMLVHKECFDALVQFRIEKLTNNLEIIDSLLFENLEQLRQDPSPSTLKAVMDMDAFDSLVIEYKNFIKAQRSNTSWQKVAL